jgi:type II secretory pathway component GspD/PulD (secretin)
MGDSINTKPLEKLCSCLLCAVCFLAFAQQEEENLIQPSGPAEAVSAAAEISEDSGKISLDLKGVDITELLRILSVKIGITIVPSKGVSGRVNVLLNDLTFEDALEVILVSQDLAAERKGKIIAVMTASEYQQLYGKKYNEKRKFKVVKLNYAQPAAVSNALNQLKSEIGRIIVDEASGTLLLMDIPDRLELLEQVVKELDAPLQTEIFDLKYAKAEDIQNRLSTTVTTGAGGLIVDERSSKLVVTDLPQKMKKIKRIVKELDEASLEVFLEAEIIQIVLKKEYQRGIDWELSLPQVKALNFKGVFPVTASFSPSPGLSAASLKWSMGTLSADDFNSVFQFLETFGDAKTLSRPRIAVMDDNEAKILVGTREAYVTQTSSQAQTTTVTSESIEFIDVGVKLNVVPTINRDGFVTLKIKPEISSVRETITTALKSRIPIVETSEAETVVKVKDGAMVMIAGLMKEEKREDTTGLPVPVISKIPILSALFKSKATLHKNTEIVVFLRPRIITGEISAIGTHLDPYFPGQLVPEDIRSEIIAGKVAEIGGGPLIPLAKSQSSEIEPMRNEKRGLTEKMKGLKQY